MRRTETSYCAWSASRTPGTTTRPWESGPTGTTRRSPFSHPMARRVRIRRVVDGDSLEVKYSGLFSFLRRPFPVRLYGIDAPELAQPYGQESRKQLASLVQRGGIRMDAMAIDRYGRTVGLLYSQSAAGMSRSTWPWCAPAWRGGTGATEAETWGSRRRRTRPNGGGAASGRMVTASAVPGTTGPTCAGRGNDDGASGVFSPGR